MSTWYCSEGVANCPICVRPTAPLRAVAVAPVTRDAPRSQAFLDLRRSMERPTRAADPIVTRRSQAVQARMDQAAAVRVEPVARTTPAPVAPTIERRTMLDVPYREKDAAKALGARWHKEAKRWYVPAGMSAAAFTRWLPGALDTAPEAPAPIAAPVPVQAWPTRQTVAAAAAVQATAAAGPVVTYDDLMAALAFAKGATPETVNVYQAVEKARHA